MSEERRVHESYQAYFDDKYWQKQYFVGPGGYFCSSNANEILTAETGSGVIICMFDVEAHVGGIAHVMIPEVIAKNFKDMRVHQKEILDFAKAPVENLINTLKRNGAGKKRINIRLSGGAEMMNDQFDMGLKNVVFCQNEVMDKGLRLITQDVGGKNCRRIHFFPYTGRMETYPLRRKSDQEYLWAREQDYLQEIREKLDITNGTNNK